MSEDVKRKEDREFQYLLTEFQVNIEYLLTVTIALLAIAVTIFVSFREDIFASVFSLALIVGDLVLVFRIGRLKNQYSKTIKEGYKLFTRTESS